MRRTLMFVAVAACGDGGQTGEEYPVPCLEGQRRYVAMDGAPYAVGFSPAELLAAIGPTQVATLTWADGGATELTVDVEPTGDAWHIEIDVNPELEYDADCPDRLEVGATVRMTTADAAFDGTFSTGLLADRGDAASFAVVTSPDVLARELPVDSSRYDSVELRVDASLSASGSAGSLVGHGTLDDGVEPFDVGRW